MALYEHIYLARQDISAQQVEALTEQFKESSKAWAARSKKSNIGA